MNLPAPRDLVPDDHNLPHPTLNTKFSTIPMMATPWPVVSSPSSVRSRTHLTTDVAASCIVPVSDEVIPIVDASFSLSSARFIIAILTVV
jgi:hypothetical protein